MICIFSINKSEIVKRATGKGIGGEGGRDWGNRAHVIPSDVTSDNDDDDDGAKRTHATVPK